MNAQPPRSKATTPWSTWAFTVVAALALLAVIAVAFAYRRQFGTAVSPVSSEWNNFGTFFGGLLGPILSMLAFFALVYTIFLQEQQLSLARATLKAADEDKELTRKQLDTAIGTQGQTVIALERQLETSREQAAVATFFEMVRLHHEIVSGITYGEAKGRDALLRYFEIPFRQLYDRNTMTVGMTRQQFDANVADQFQHSHSNSFGHYFRNLYRIYKFVDENDAIKNKTSLTGIIRAQLTLSELGLIFYNGISSGGTKFKPLLEKYAVFESFNKNGLLSPDSRNDYEPAAWGQNYNKL